MRELPKEEDEEKHRRARPEGALGGRPAQDRRERARHRAHQRAERRLALQGRIETEVARDRRQRNRRGQEVHEEREVGHASRRKQGPEDRRLGRVHPSRRERPGLRPVHLRVGLALEKHVERRRAGRAEERPRDEMEEEPPVERRRRRDVEADARRDRDHERDPGLRERHEIAHPRPRHGRRDRDGDGIQSLRGPP